SCPLPPPRPVPADMPPHHHHPHAPPLDDYPEHARPPADGEHEQAAPVGPAGMVGGVDVRAEPHSMSSSVIVVSAPPRSHATPPNSHHFPESSTRSPHATRASRVLFC